MTNFCEADFYSDKINHMTLEECLKIHYQLNSQFTPFYKYSSQIASSLIKAHDITHVVFGCDTSYLGELKVQSWTKFGVDLNIKKEDRLKYFLDKDARALLTPKGILGFVMWHLTVIWDVIWKVRRQSRLMTKKWVYFQEDSYMHNTIGEIRKEFGIVLL